MEVMLMVVFICLSNVFCLIVGVNVGQKASRGEEIKLPDPVSKVQSTKEAEQYRKEQEALDTMLYNIDVYNGTSMGQKDIP